MDSSSNSVTFFRTISKYAIVILELTTEFMKTMIEYFRRSVAFVRAVQCRVKLTTRRAKSQGGLDGIEDVITSLFLKPTACTSDMVFSLYIIYCTAELIFVFFFVCPILFFFNTVFLCLCFYAFVFYFVLYW